MVDADINTMEWLAKEQKSLEEQQQKAFEEKGMKKLYRLTEGEHEFTVDVANPPRDQDTIYGVKKVFVITQDGNEYDLMVNPGSPFYPQIINELAAGRTTLRVMRSGTGLATRYKILPAKPKPEAPNVEGSPAPDSEQA